MRDLGAVLVGLLFIGFAACSGPKSDDDDDDDGGGESGNGASGGTTSSGGSGGTTSSGGSGGTTSSGGTGAVGPGPSDCQTVCNRANACEKPADVTFDLNQCTTSCTGAQAVCPAETGEYVACFSALSDICVIYDEGATPPCQYEVTQYYDCMSAYCAANPSASVCN